MGIVGQGATASDPLGAIGSRHAELQGLRNAESRQASEGVGEGFVLDGLRDVDHRPAALTPDGALDETGQGLIQDFDILLTGQDGDHRPRQSEDRHRRHSPAQLFVSLAVDEAEGVGVEGQGDKFGIQGGRPIQPQAGKGAASTLAPGPGAEPRSELQITGPGPEPLEELAVVVAHPESTLPPSGLDPRIRSSNLPPVRFLFVMDPVAPIDIDADSTFVLMWESQERGHRVDWALMPSLALDGAVPKAKARRLTLRRQKGDHFDEGPLQDVRLDDYDAVFMRKDPPYDLDFHLATLVLDRADRTKTVLVNEPGALRDFNEKLAAFIWADFMPPSMATADRDRIRAFLKTHGECIVKPLLNAGGEGIIRLAQGDKNIGSVLDLLTQFGRTMIEVQKFVPDVSKGDKRIIVVDGEAVGAINRIPSSDDNRANMHVGGRAEPVGLDERDQAIVAALGPELRRRGLVLVGLDVIGGFLTEVNVTSPTGLQELARFDGVHAEKTVIDWVERKRGALSHSP